jgi:protein MpaA
MVHRPTIAIAACCLALAAAAPASGKGLINGSPVATGVALHGSPYRYLTLTPPGPRTTVVARVDRRGGRIDHWWALAGRFTVTAPAYDMVGAGLSADENVLVLSQLRQSLLVRRSRLTILNTRVHDRYPAARRNGDFSTVILRGDYGVQAVSPDGATAFLSHLLSAPPDPVRFTLRALDTASGKLLPRFSIPGNGEILSGMPITRLPDRRGRVVYTLYWEDDGTRPARRRVSILALDTVAPRLRRIELPQLRSIRDPMLLRLRLDKRGRRLTVAKLSRNDADPRPAPLLRIDTRTLDVVPRPRPAAYVTERVHVVGRSAGGREIRLRQLGNPNLQGRLLVFGCVHGDECAARGIEPLTGGCPDPDSNIYLVPTLDPDGAALGTRLNGRGVDLNHNFPVGWRPIGKRWDPQYAGPQPFSEPETRLAARIVRAVDPRVTIWFHQHHGPGAFVRAWGPAIPAGSHFAALAGIRFLPLHWLAGTAPRWQNNTFPGTASFVVELPPGELAPGLEERLEQAIVRLGRGVGEN